MSLIWGGKLKTKLSPYTSAIVKSNIANKYGSYHYSTKAYASPVLTTEEWEIVFRAATELKVPYKENQDTWYVLPKNATEDSQAYINENRVNFKKKYLQRLWEKETDETSIVYNPNNAFNAMPHSVIEKILSYVDSLKKLGTIETGNQDLEVIDRFEKCIVRDKGGLIVSTDEQKKNLLRYYQDDKSSSYVIYYDSKTMLPLLHIENGEIIGWEHQKDSEGVDQGDTKFILRRGTVYYKWSRTVKYASGIDEGSLGKILTIDAETFPGDYKIVGETYIKEQKTGKNQRYQFSINRAQISTDTSISLEAEGDPTTFSMSVDVLTPPSGEMIELKQFDVDDDIMHGGTNVISQRSSYTYTDTELKSNAEQYQTIYNDEII